jgi:hypothetical protein
MSRYDYQPTWCEALAFDPKKPEEILSDIDDVHTPAAYAFELLQPKNKQTLIDDWEYWFDTEPPSWAWAAFHSNTVYYVGGTSDIWFRVQDHAEPDRGAKIMKCFPRRKVEIIEPCPNEDAAFEREEQLADELESDDVFVFQA